MSTANALRQQIEAHLAHRIPAALTPAPDMVRAVSPVGIQTVDALLRGGLPVGAVTELVGPECSGRTSLALSFVARMTEAGKVCAWVDALDSLSPESAAANGVALNRLLWVRCGAMEKKPKQDSAATFSLPEKYFAPPSIVKGLHGGGGGPHPRMEEKGLSAAVEGLLRPEPQRRVREEKVQVARGVPTSTFTVAGKTMYSPATRVDQALRVTDLLLQGGGFGAIVLDLGGVEPEVATRVPLATWFRYRAAAEKGQTSILLLTRMACARSSAGLVLRLLPGSALEEEATVFTGMNYQVEATRERFQPISNVVPMRKPPQRETTVAWQSRAGVR
jgi:recombination protein RecA